jgi:hypothetical protein
MHAEIYLRKKNSGYQGIKKIHVNSEYPKKKSEKNPLTKSDKKTIERFLTPE